MIRTLVRRYLVGVLGLAAAGSVQAQFAEVFAGGKTVSNFPALEAPLVPGKVAVGPDDSIYVVNEHQMNLLRRDHLTGLVALKAPGTTSSFYHPSHYVFFGRPGFAYVMRNLVLYEINQSTGAAVTMANLWLPGAPTCSFRQPVDSDMAADQSGAVYFTDWERNSVCKVVGTTVTRIAGTDAAGFSGDGGPAAGALFNYPTGLAVDAAGNVYVADTGNDRIRRIAADTGIITTIAGNGGGLYAGENVPAATSSVANPTHLGFDATGSLLFVEGMRVRRIDAQTGLMTTVAGNGAFSDIAVDGGLATQTPLGWVASLALTQAGDILLSDRGSLRVRKIARDTGIITSIIGNGTTYYCGENVQPREACLHRPTSVAVHTNGDLYIADTSNRRIRKVSASTGRLTTIAGRSAQGAYQGEGGPAVDAVFGDSLGGVALDAAGNVYVAGGFGNRILRIEQQTGLISTIGGQGLSGFSGDGGPALQARFYLPWSVAVAGNGDIYVADRGNHRVRKIAASTGVVTTVAGSGLATGPVGDGGPATLASLNQPTKVGFDLAGNLLIADSNHYRIRKLDLTTGIITTVVGNGVSAPSGDGGPATAAAINNARTFFVDSAGHLFLQDLGTMRRVDAVTGIITRVGPQTMMTADGYVLGAYDLALAPNGRVYAGDYNVVFRITGLPVAVPDVSPPQVMPTVTGIEGSGGWYRSDVQVSWSVSDGESTITSSSGCEEGTVNTDTNGTTFTCSATSAGGTATSSVTIQRDTVAPTLEFDTGWLSPDESGWHRDDVTIPFTASDALSGVWSTSTGSPLNITGTGANLTAEVTVIDRAGNSATFTSPSVSIDRTPPVLTPSVSGTLGSNGWYTSAVDVEWTVTDPESPITYDNGCGPDGFGYDSAGVTFNCEARSSGGSSVQTITVKKDSTPPTAWFGYLTPLPPSGWFSGDVSFEVFSNDETSGVATISPNPAVVTGSGAGLTTSVEVTDHAGNVATFTTPSVDIDRTAPVVTPAISGTLGANGWYTSDVQVAWAIDESPGNIISSTGCGTSSVTSDTVGVTFTCSVVSGGGNAAASVTIKRDATPPQLTFGAASPAPNSAGWNRTNVSVPYTASDLTSGIASASAPSPLVLSAEGAGVTGEVQLTDQAGNTASFTTVARNIDKTAPVVSLSSPANGVIYGFYQNVPADFACTDVSLRSCSGTVADGAMVNTRTAGTRTFTATGRDEVSFVTSVTNTFTVMSFFNFGGEFLPPMNRPPTLNVVSRGSLVPIRWQLPDGQGGYVTNTASFVSATVGSLSCGGAPTAPLNDIATGPAGISFDPATSSFVYNWQTSSSWTGCRRLTIKLRDNSTWELRFRFQ